MPALHSFPRLIRLVWQLAESCQSSIQQWPRLVQLPYFQLQCRLVDEAGSQQGSILRIIRVELHELFTQAHGMLEPMQRIVQFAHRAIQIPQIVFTCREIFTKGVDIGMTLDEF